MATSSASYYSGSGNLHQVKTEPPETMTQHSVVVLWDHDYAIRHVAPDDLPMIKEMERNNGENASSSLSSLSSSLSILAAASASTAADCDDENYFSKKFSKCEKCRRSRTKVLVPNSVLSVAHGKNDGVTCDFCGDVMSEVQPLTLPDVFEGRRGSKGGDLVRDAVSAGDDVVGGGGGSSRKRKVYVYCGECGKVVLKESLVKHMRDVHELSNKKQCPLCSKMLSGPFSLKEHISAVHNKQTKHQCPKCAKMFAHFSNMNRHIRLIHNKMVVTHKYVNCHLCRKVVQSTSLKKHMSAIHEQRRDFRCAYCEKSFAQSYTLKEHVAAKHTFAYGHKCRLCGKAFAHKTNCGRHLKTVHKKQVKGKYATEHEMIRDCIESVGGGGGADDHRGEEGVVYS